MPLHELPPHDEPLQPEELAHVVQNTKNIHTARVHGKEADEACYACTQLRGAVADIEETVYPASEEPDNAPRAT